MGYRAVVIDDQKTARRGIALAIEAVEEVDVVAEFSGGEAALEGLRSTEPDLVFVDVSMDTISGLDLVRRVELDAPAAFIFVTAYDEHAVAAFDVEAVDFVTKPFTDERLITATRRGIERLRAVRSRAALEGLRETLGEPTAERGPDRVGSARGGRRRYGEPRYVTVRRDDRIRLVPLSEISWVEADRSRVRLHTGSEQHVVRTGLARMLDSLGTGRFIRVHRSHAVNIDAVREIQPWFNGDYLAIMRDGEKLRISRRYKDAILKRVL